MVTHRFAWVPVWQSDNWHIGACKAPHPPGTLHSFLKHPNIMCGPAFEYTFEDFLNDASDAEWDEWEQKAAELELPVDYYVQEFI